MKIAIISDTHDNLTNLQKAIEIANNKACEMLLFAGDLNFPGAVQFLAKFNGPVHMVWGNNEGDRVKVLSRVSEYQNVQHHLDMYVDTIDGLMVFMTHYPEIAELARESNKYSLVIYGHTHEYDEQNLDTVTVINPGAVFGYPTDPSFAIFDTKTKHIEKIML